MASIRRQRNRYEIRECVVTPNGPRQLTLASFSGGLTPEVLDQAEERASRPFHRQRLRERARAMGIPVVHKRRYPEARALLARLRRGGGLEPGLVALLQTELGRLRAVPLPPHLADAADWIGQPDRERGRALRGLVRTADRILASRGPLRVRPKPSFPRFSSRGPENTGPVETRRN